MTILSAQSIRELSRPMSDRLHNTVRLKCGWGNFVRDVYQIKPLLDPFVERGVVRGKSFGLSACTYDCRISDGLLIPVGQGRLAATIERFCLPTDVCGSVLDKSTWARVFVTAFNTHIDPGWEGFLTVELVNLGTEAVEYLPGDPVCQVKFEWLDVPTDLPYSGKYQNQEAGPQSARYEREL